MVEDFAPKEHFGHKEVGYKYRAGPVYATPTEVDLFCAITGSREEHFLEDEAGKALDIGSRGRILPGILTFAVTGALLDRTGLSAPGVLIEASNLKFITPVAPYDRLYLEGEVISKRVTSKADRVVMKYSISVKNHNDDMVLQAELTELFPNPNRP
jgi:acyl dehydratase